MVCWSSLLNVIDFDEAYEIIGFSSIFILLSAFYCLGLFILHKWLHYCVCVCVCLSVANYVLFKWKCFWNFSLRFLWLNVICFRYDLQQTNNPTFKSWLLSVLSHVESKCKLLAITALQNGSAFFFFFFLVGLLILLKLLHYCVYAKVLLTALFEWECF